MSEMIKQNPAIPYPRGVGRGLMRAPLLLYRMGFGGLLNTAHIMILGTRGRKSDLPRYTPIEYRQHGSKIYVVSAWGSQPQWYKNLLATPDVIVQRGSCTVNATAEVVTNSGEALRVLRLFRRRAPFVYDPLIARLSAQEQIDERRLPDIAHTITMVRLDPQPGSPTLPPLKADSGWILPAVVALFMLVAVSLGVSRSRHKAD